MPGPDDPPYVGERVEIGVLLRGYRQAYHRYAAAADRHDAIEETYFALFEALNWVIAIDDVIGKVWRPAGEAEKFAWRQRFPGAEVIDGVRLARNLLHHHWARAPRIEFALGRHGWVWPTVEDLPPATEKWDRAKVPTYSRLLTGRSVSDTLYSVGAIFDQVATFLDPPRARSRPS